MMTILRDVLIKCFRVLHACLSLRFTRFRHTAFPTFLLTTNPNLELLGASGTLWHGKKINRKSRDFNFDPRFWINRKSLDFLILSTFCQVTFMESSPIDSRKPTPRYYYLVRISGAKRLRPFERRRRKTFLPPGVLIRARKPWQRFRLILLGWYVRFISTPQKCTILMYRKVSLSDIDEFVNINRSHYMISYF